MVTPSSPLNRLPAFTAQHRLKLLSASRASALSTHTWDRKLCSMPARPVCEYSPYSLCFRSDLTIMAAMRSLFLNCMFNCMGGGRRVRQKPQNLFSLLELARGIEPPTDSLQNYCSAD